MKNLPALFHRLARCASVLALTAAGPALAQPAGADGDDFLYRVMKGDTLLELAVRYTATPQNWPALQRINNVADTLALPIGKVLRIPFSMIPEVPAPARLVHASGQVLMSGGVVNPGDQLPEGSTLATAPGGFATLLLTDGSTLTVPSNSTIAIERLQAFEGTGLTDTILSVENGSVESVVAPEETGVGRFEIRTPVAITGVRGTRLRVHRDQAGAQTEVLAGVAHLGATAAGQAMLKPGQGVATGADGVMGAVRALPAAPQLSEPVRGPQRWQVAFDPVPGASAYLVRVADDPDGARPRSSQRYNSPEEVRFSAQGPGTHYVLIRAIGQDGLMGPDAAQPFEGLPVLISGSGNPVMAGYGGQVYLTAY